MSDLAKSLDTVRQQIRDAERAAGREEGSVALLPVTKFHRVERIEELASLGIALVGENREQEARDKAAELEGLSLIHI